MQSYIIHSFKRISDNSIWIRQETGTNSGGYVKQTTDLAQQIQAKRLNDFICESDFKIWSVYKGTIGSIIFTIGDRISTNHFRQEENNPLIIFSFKIELGNVVIFMNQQAPNNRVLLQNITKYTIPVATKVETATVKKSIGRTKKVTTNTAFDEITKVIEGKIKPIRLERTLKKRKETIEQFLVVFFREWNSEKNTIYVDTLEVQTESGKRRSLGDIYMILKYYYPNITLNEVLKLLYNVLPTLITDGFRSSYCSTINKRVWYYDSDDRNGVYDKTRNDEYGKPHSFYVENII